MIKNKLLLLEIIFICALLFACNNNKNSKPEPTDTPTSGEVAICVDESYSLLFDTQIYTFQSQYINAKVRARYVPENTALKALLDDSCKVAVLNRDLTKEEKKLFEQNNIYPKSTKIAEDALAFVINNENSDSVFTVDQIKNILLGSYSLWSDINKASLLGAVNVVFDNAGSANARYLQDSVLMGKQFSKNVFAVKSNAEVIDYVNKNKNAIGVVSVNWISDKDDTLTRRFLKKIKVAAISLNDSSKAYKPYQAHIKTKKYVFCRDVYMINRQTRAGLGMGFVSFVAGEQGQLIILKSGLIPSIAPVRIIEMK